MIADLLTDLELSRLEKKIEMSERERYPTTLLPTRTLRLLFDGFVEKERIAELESKAEKMDGEVYGAEQSAQESDRELGGY